MRRRSQSMDEQLAMIDREKHLPSKRGHYSLLLRPRLAGLFGDRDLGNNTPLADAIASLLAYDAVNKDIDPKLVNTLSDDILIELAQHFEERLYAPLKEAKALPFGSLLELNRRAMIDGQILLPVAGKPGLYPFQEVEESAHGPNLTRFQEIFARKLAGHKLESIGQPRPSTTQVFGIMHHLDFAPFAPVANVVLRQRVTASTLDGSFCSLMEKDLENLADCTLRSVENLWVQRTRIRERVAQVRNFMQERLLREYGEDGPVKLQSIALDWDEEVGEDSYAPYLHVDFRAINDALRPGMVSIALPGDMNLNVLDDSLRHRFEHRSQQITNLRARNAVGIATDLAAALIRAAPEGEHEVLRRLSNELEITLKLTGNVEDLYARLYWNGGEVFAALYETSALAQSFGKFRVRGTVPEAARLASIGKPLSEIVALPFPLQSRISGITTCKDGWTEFDLQPFNRLILEGGRLGDVLTEDECDLFGCVL